MDSSSEDSSSDITSDDSSVSSDSEEEDVVQESQLPSFEKLVNPKSIAADHHVYDISLHPRVDIIAFGDAEGDINFARYGIEDSAHVGSIEVHCRPCRSVDFNSDGRLLYSASSDRTIAVCNTEKTEMVQFYDNAHESAIGKLLAVDQHEIISGDSDGIIKFWDTRQRDKAVFTSKKTNAYISSIVIDDNRRCVACNGDEGRILFFEYRQRCFMGQTEELPSDLNCAALFKGNSKLVCGSQSGVFYLFPWGKEFDKPPDKFSPYKATKKKATEINSVLVATDTICISGWEDGHIRAVSLFPNKILGIVGKMAGSVEFLDISHDGTYLASADFEEIKFWNISFLENIDLNMKAKSRDVNLPSSNLSDRSNFFSSLESKHPFEDACGEALNEQDMT